MNLNISGRLIGGFAAMGLILAIADANQNVADKAVTASPFDWGARKKSSKRRVIKIRQV